MVYIRKTNCFLGLYIFLTDGLGELGLEFWSQHVILFENSFTYVVRMSRS